MNLNDWSPEPNTLSFRSTSDFSSAMEALAIWAGTIVTALFMLSVIGHGYLSLHLIPTLTFVPDDLAGILLAVGFALFNWVGFRKIFSSWTKGTRRARLFILIACILIVGIEFVLALAGIVAQNAGNDYMKAASQRIDRLISTAQQIDVAMTRAYGDHLAVLRDGVDKAKRGDDVTGDARCGAICQARIVKRDKLEEMFHSLDIKQSFNGIAESDDLTQRFGKLHADMQTLGAKYATFAEFEKISPVPLAAGGAYRGLVEELATLKREVFGEKDVLTRQGLIFRLTAETVSRCVNLVGTVGDYISCVLALGLIMLIPAFSVAGNISPARQSELRARVTSTQEEADLYDALQVARARRGQSKMNADVTDRVWETLSSAKSHNGR